MKSTLLLAAFASVLLLGASEKASADPSYYDFDFSIDAGGGNFITGTLVGLENNATTSPYDIFINHDPFNAAIGAGGYSLANNGYVSSQYVDGRFTVADGVLTGVGQGGDGIGTGLQWYKVLSPGPDPEYSQIGYSFDTFDGGDGDGFNGESYEAGTDPTVTHGNGDGFEGTTFSLGTLSNVPEPSKYGWAVFLALAAAISWKRFSRSQQAA